MYPYLISNECFLVGFLKAFSLIENSKNLFCKTERESEISCLYGIKAITMAWVTMVHVSFSYRYGGVLSVDYFIKVRPM